MPFVADILEDTLPIHSISKSQMEEHDYRGRLNLFPVEIFYLKASFSLVLLEMKKNLYNIELELLRIVRQHLDGAVSKSGDTNNGVAAVGFTPELDLDQVVRVLLKRAGKANSKDGTRAAAVRWLCQLQLLCPQKVINYEFSSVYCLVCGFFSRPKFSATVGFSS